MEADKKPPFLLGSAEVNSVKPLDSDKAGLLELLAAEWTDEDGERRRWEFVRRRVRKETRADMAHTTYIVPLISSPKSHQVHTVVTLQFRPPVNRIVVDFPAGLVEPGETEQECALRELREETGFGRAFAHLKGSLNEAKVKVLDVSNVVATEPAITATKLKRVLVRVQLPTVPEDSDLMKDQFMGHDDEHIVTGIVPINDLYDILKGLSERPGYVIAQSLWSFADGYRMSQVLA